MVLYDMDRIEAGARRKDSHGVCKREALFKQVSISKVLLVRGHMC